MATKARRRAGILAVVLFCGLCFGLVPAFAGDNAEPVIKGAEYEVMKVVLEKYPSSTVDKTTLSGKLSANLDKWKFDPQLDKDIVGDLDEKNKAEVELPAEFTGRMPRVLEGEGKERVELSRVGFDKASEHALLLVKTTYYTREDIMNEGQYILLTLKDGKWMIEKTASAWGMMLGK